MRESVADWHREMSKADQKKVTIADLIAMKKAEKISVITAYDYCTALICDRANIDIILVGDSGGMVMLGYPNTIRVELNEMLVFCGAVSRGTSRSLVVGDMPFGSYQPGPSHAVENAVKMIKAGCDAVKLEGGSEIRETVEAIVQAGIPVMGHIGLKPQTATLWEGYKVQGKTVEAGKGLLADAQSLQEAGIFSIVLEMVSTEVAAAITQSLSIPTIGIGSGAECDGQVLVLHDLLGLYDNIKPKFAIRNADLSKVILDAVSKYSSDVKAGKFPEEVHTFHMNPNEITKWKSRPGNRKD